MPLRLQIYMIFPNNPSFSHKKQKLSLIFFNFLFEKSVKFTIFADDN